MKRLCIGVLFALACVAASAMCSDSHAQVNMLTNPGFEEGGGSYDGWFTWGDGPNISTPDTDNIARTDTSAAKIFGEFSFCPIPVFDDGGFGQAFTPTAGKIYQFNGYSFVANIDSLYGEDTCNNNRCVAKVVFFDADSAGNELSGNEVIIGDATTPLEEWHPFSVSALAPSGALRVEALIIFLQPGCDTGSVFIDDTSFYELPEPAADPNVLVNPSFDTDLDGWTTFGNVYYDGRAIFHRTPTGSAKLYSTFSDSADSGMFQKFEASPCSQWKLDVYSLNTCRESPIYGGNDNFAVAKIVFRDAANNEIGSRQTVITDSTSALGTWTFNSVTACAPAGTDSVEAFVLFISPSLNQGAVWVDDLNFQDLGTADVPGEGRRPNDILMQNVPNPFRSSTRIAFALERTGRVKLHVFDAKGRLVRVLVDEMREPSTYVEAWDGRDGRGRSVSAGVYFYRLEIPGTSAVRKMTLAK
jgi:hypothetical protein